MKFGSESSYSIDDLVLVRNWPISFGRVGGVAKIKKINPDLTYDVDFLRGEGMESVPVKRLRKATADDIALHNLHTEQERIVNEIQRKHEEDLRNRMNNFVLPAEFETCPDDDDLAHDYLMRAYDAAKLSSDPEAFNALAMERFKSRSSYRARMDEIQSVIDEFNDEFGTPFDEVDPLDNLLT